MIDLDRETPVTLAEAPALIPTINALPGMTARKPITRRTIYNWARRGHHGVVLDTLPIGGVIITTQQAMQRFFEQLSVVRQNRIERRPRDRGLCDDRMPPRRASRVRTLATQKAVELLRKKHGI